MGIPKFSSWLERKYPTVIQQRFQGNEQISNPDEIQVDNLYLDMNEIIYSCAKLDDLSALRDEKEIIQSVFQCIDEIFSIVRPRKLLYMAIDGVAPKAKIHKQRAGLFHYAKKHLPEDEQFTKCDIKPGTKFMSKLSIELQHYIYYCMNVKSAWKSIIVVLSDANVPGEGEHKIMDFIRTQKSHNLHANHVLFSTDSDIVLLGLTLHSDHIWIMRGKNDKTQQYTFVNLKLLRKEINDDLTKDLLPSMNPGLKTLIDDWIFMCFLAGNDFLPNLPFIEFDKVDHIKVLMNCYKEYILKENGYLVEGMEPNLKYLKILLKHIGKNDKDTVMSLLKQDQTPSSFSLDETKKQALLSTLTFGPPSFQRSRNPSPAKKNEASACALSTVLKNDSSNDADQSYKNDWYRKKFAFKQAELAACSIKVAESYAQGLCWMLHYYYEGVPSWDWYYPYYYPPLASTFLNLENISIDFIRNSQPMKPLEQMMVTFPSKYARYLPEKWQPLMLDIKSPIFDLYRTDPVEDPYGKRYENQYIVKLPFFDEQRLFKALRSIDSTLSEEEEKRNRYDNDRLFIHLTNPYYEKIKNIYKNYENQITLSGSMSGQILLDDAKDTENDQVFSFKYRRLSRDFTKPLKRFDTEVSYDSAEAFFEDLGFNKDTINRLQHSFPALKQFVHYDIFSVIDNIESDVLFSEDHENEYNIESQQDFFQVLCLFGFRNEWAQTYTWAMGKAYDSQLVKHSIEECIQLRLSPVNKIQPFPDWIPQLGNNEWLAYDNPEFRNGEQFVIRRQSRNGNTNSGLDLNDIDFIQLTNLTHRTHKNSQYWYHATDWNGAHNILRNGIAGHGLNTDFSRGPAFYLNNSYLDSYEFLTLRNHIFNGRHAIFIYEFNPEQLSDRHYVYIGQENDAHRALWKNIVFTCVNRDQREAADLHGCRCVFGRQCRNPNNVRTRSANRNTPERRTRSFDGQYAQQLAIRTNNMWQRIDTHLIGLVIFQHT